MAPRRPATSEWKAPPWWKRFKRAHPRAPVRHVSSVPFGASLGLHRFVLSNGLVVLIVPDHSAPVVSYHTWFRVGSRHERPGKTGLAHLFEHLMFKETKHRGAGEFDRALERVGADNNASTWTDWTQYHENVPKRALPLVVALEADRMAHLVLSPKQVASEKEVVANERRWRVDDDVDGTASELLYRTAFKKHPYRWPTIGWMKDIQGFTVRDCLAFYRTYYAPNNAVVVVVGDVDGAEVLSLVTEHYGAMRRAKIPVERTPREPGQTRMRRAKLRLPTPSDRLLLGVHGPAFGTQEHVHLSVAHEILLGGRASRLYQRLVVKDKLVTDIGGFISPFRDPGLWEISAMMRPGRRAEAVERILFEEITRIADEGVTPEELERAKNRLELAFLGGLETAGGKAEQVGFYELVTGNPTGAFDRLAAYQRVTAAEVRQAVAKVFKPSRATVVVVVPTRGAA